MNWWKALQLASYLMGWYARASADGKVTADELAEAVRQAATVLDIDIDVTPPPQ